MYGRIIALLFLIPALFAQDDAFENALYRGTLALRAAQYREASAAFERAVSLNPSHVQAQLLLSTAYVAQWTPGLTNPVNDALALNAETAFKRVLKLQSNNEAALRALASLTFYQRRLDAAREWNRRLIGVAPNDKGAYYSLGVIAVTEFSTVLKVAREKSGMTSADSGPLRDPILRANLRRRFSPLVSDGIQNLQRAIDLDASYADAMAYMNLLIRQRGDLADTPEQWRADIMFADQWVERANAVRQAQAGSSEVPPQ